MSKEPIKSPCVKVCAVDGQTGWCLGCGRTLGEIGGWSALSPEDRDAVMEKLPERLEALRKAGKFGDAA